MNLTEFLLARIEEEREGIESSGVWDDEWQRRALAECEAKRRIIEAHKIEGRPESVWHDREDGLRQLVKVTEYTCSVCGWVGEDGPDGCGTTGCDTLRALALPYADHPDYREEWRP